MKKTLYYIIAIFTISVFSELSAQNYNMGNLGTVNNSCGGTFYDSGGSIFNYFNNENYTATFCAPTGQYITFNFSSFDVENTFEFLTVYNGPNTSSPLIGSYTGTSSPGTITSTLGGCLTFTFTSDGSVTKSGWVAAITCSSTPPPPPPPVPGTCGTADPFCTSTGITFPAATGTTAPTGPNYGCLTTQPNPAWYYLNIATSGVININLSNSANADIDFIAWGPFANQNDMCTAIFGGAVGISCSYSSSPNEQVNIPNALSGEWYMVMITNYSNQPTNITAAADPANTGTTNCNILCSMTGLTAVPGACDPATGQYSVTGQITLSYPPTSGTLTVSSSCGGSTTVPTPWTSPISYTLAGLTANGAGCNITATFSADTTCTYTTPYISPAPCSGCSVTAGNSGPVCEGATFNLTATTVTGATYSWTSSTGFTSSNQNPSGVTAPLVAGSYTYTVTATSGSSTCTSVTTLIVTDPSVTVNSDTICSGQSTTLTATPTSAGGTYLWNPGSQTTQSITVSPATTTSYNVTYTLNGCVGSPVSGTVTVIPGSTAPTSAAASPDTICGGSTTLTVSGGSLGTGASWNWYSGTCGGTFVGTGAALVVFPSATTTYFVQANGTCDTTTCVSVIVTIDGGSTAPSGSTASPLNVCQGSSTLTVNGGALGTGADWNWYSGSCNGTPEGTGTSITVSPLTTTTYYVNAVGTCNTTLCDSVTITVDTLSINPTSVTASANPVCTGDSTILTVNGGSLGSGASWNWYSGSCNGSFQGTGSTLTVFPSVTTTYFVNAVGTCNITLCDSLTVIVNTPSFAPVNITANISPVCMGTSSTLTVNGGSLGTAANWNWYSGSCTGVLIGTGTSIVVTPSATTTYFVQAIGICNTTSCVSLTLNVDQAPNAANAGTDMVVCGLSSNLGGNIASVGTGTWTSTAVPGALIFSNSNDQNTAITATNYGTYSIAWNITNGSCFTSDTMNITFTENPGIAYAGADVTVCDGGVQLKANAPVAGNGFWTIITGTGTLADSSSNNSFVTNLQEGQNLFLWTVYNGVCPSSTDTIIVIVNPSNLITNFSANPTVSYTDEEIVFKDLSTGSPISWSWFFGDGSTSDIQNPTHIYTSSGTYTVTLIIENQAGCIDSSTTTVEIIEGIIVPNVFSPNGDGINDLFEIKSSGVIEFSLVIYNRFGLIVFETNSPKTFWDGKNKAGKPVSDGTYFYILHAVFKTLIVPPKYGTVNVLR